MSRIKILSMLVFMALPLWAIAQNSVTDKPSTDSQDHLVSLLKSSAGNTTFSVRDDVAKELCDLTMSCGLEFFLNEMQNFKETPLYEVYLPHVVGESLPDGQKDFLLKHLKDNPILCGILIERGWEADASEIISEILQEPSVPQRSVIIAAVNTKKNSLTRFALEKLSGHTPQFQAKVLLHDIKCDVDVMRDIAAKLWKNFAGYDKSTQCHVAAAAFSVGIVEALDYMISEENLECSIIVPYVEDTTLEIVNQFIVGKHNTTKLIDMLRAGSVTLKFSDETRRYEIV